MIPNQGAQPAIRRVNGLTTWVVIGRMNASRVPLISTDIVPPLAVGRSRRDLRVMARGDRACDGSGWSGAKGRRRAIDPAGEGSTDVTGRAVSDTDQATAVERGRAALDRLAQADGGVEDPLIVVALERLR
jgi:hypothetical protein